MIKYNLECECGKTFVSWFSSSNEYNILNKKNFISCIHCNSTSIKKSLMAPNLNGKSNKIQKQIKFEKIVKKELVELRKYIEKNCRNVGENFPKEARSIYYDKKTSKGIYGKATPEETIELLEEGIDVATIPWLNRTEN